MVGLWHNVLKEKMKRIVSRNKIKHFRFYINHHFTFKQSFTLMAQNFMAKFLFICHFSQKCLRVLWMIYFYSQIRSKKFLSKFSALSGRKIVTLLSYTSLAYLPTNILKERFVKFWVFQLCRNAFNKFRVAHICSLFFTDGAKKIFDISFEFL